ncbi:Retrovirus-related Pol polyprotein from transposon 412 [Formica fusca]
MIPEFDGLPNKLQEFLSATTYAVEHIDPLEVTLLGAVLCTKLKGRSMLDFQTRKIRDFAQFKRELEVCYASKKSTTHLQIELNTLKQKNGESARTYGLRADKLAMELYESMMEGRHHTVDNKRAIMEIIQQQALENFQIGLQDEIKTIVRSRGYATLQEAIAAASAEEKVKGPSATGTRSKINFTPTYKQENQTNVKCQKCGKTGHYGRDCRTSRYANRFSLPKSDRQPRVNTVNKYCNYCKKSRHDREECWLLHGRPNRDQSSRTKQCNSRPENKNRKSNEQAKRRSNTAHSSDEEDKEETKQRRPAIEYRVTHVKRAPRTHTGLDLVALPMRESKKGKINLLFDTGIAISLIKVKHLKDETLITEDKIALTGVTGHKVYTIGRINATINLYDGRVKHKMYVVKDDFPIEYDGILGVDFLKKQGASCNYSKKQLRIARNNLKLYPYQRTTLQPRSETIIQVATNKNMIGIIQAEEAAPGVFIGSCLVDPQNYLCPASVINTTDNIIEMLMPQVTIEEIAQENTVEINATQAKKGEDDIPRTEKVTRALRIDHLNKEELKAIKEICENYSDIFHIEGKPLTCTNTIAHKIATQADSSPVNVWLFACRRSIKRK